MVNQAQRETIQQQYRQSVQLCHCLKFCCCCFVLCYRHTIVDSIVSLQSTTKLCIVKDLTVLDITNRIMRKENYWIALINMDCIDLTLTGNNANVNHPSSQPSISSSLMSSSSVPFETFSSNPTIRQLDVQPQPTTNPTINHTNAPFSRWSHIVFGTTLEWNLKFCILNSMFDSHFTIRQG